MSSVPRGVVSRLDALLRSNPRTRFALGIAAVALLLLAASYFLSRPSATLSLVCRHDFRKGELTVSIDGEVVHSATLTGSTVRKFLGVVEQTQGTYTATLPVRPGDRSVQVRVRGPGYDRTRSTEAEFRRAHESTLVVDAGRGLALSWREASTGAGSAPTAASVPAWVTYAGSILLTIFGSIVSAAIGVVVQDYLRVRKVAAKGAAGPSSSPDR